MTTRKLIGSKALDATLKRSGSQSAWTYKAATPSKKAIRNMEKRASANAKLK